MQWYHPFGLNAKKIVHQRWLHMVEVNKSTNGMVGKPWIKKYITRDKSSITLGFEFDIFIEIGHGYQEFNPTN
jgi:hypothetical protein